ncbi:MAG: hypothetical protein V4565_11815 [Bacteroidota bacterium]
MNFFLFFKQLVSRNQLVVNIVCFAVFCEIILQYKYNPIWNFYPDHVDYLSQSSFSLSSISFYSPKPSWGFSPRPFTVPLFYKIMFGDQLSIVWMQKIMHCLCALSFITAISILIKNKVVCFLAIPVLYYFFTWWPIVGFTENLISESLSMSFLFLWLATIIYFIHYKNNFSFICLLIVSVLFSFTRDTWPYIILFSNVLLFIYFSKSVILKKYLVVSFVFSIGLFFIQSYTAIIGERYKIPIYNVLAVRISKNTEYIKWFQEKGMPLGDSLSINFGRLDLNDDKDVQTLYDSYYNKTYIPLHNWIVEHGKNTYMFFMLTHPAYFFLDDETDLQKERIFAIYDLNYTPKSSNLFLDNNTYRDTFSLITLFSTLLILLGFSIVLKYKNTYVFFPFFVLILFTLNVYLSYNADTLEVERHLFITQIMIQLIIYTTLIFIVDAVYSRMAFYFTKKKSKIES